MTLLAYGDVVTVVRPGVKTSRSGDPLPDWSDSAVTRIPAPDVLVQPAGASTEQATEQRDLTITRWLVASKPGTDLDVRATDRVEYAGITCQVDGEVGRWPDPTRAGVVHHVEFAISRAQG